MDEILREALPEFLGSFAAALLLAAGDWSIKKFRDASPENEEGNDPVQE